MPAPSCPDRPREGGGEPAGFQNRTGPDCPGRRRVSSPASGYEVMSSRSAATRWVGGPKMGSRQETDGDDPCTEIWHEPPCAKDPAPGRTAFDPGVSRSILSISALMKDLGSQPSDRSRPSYLPCEAPGTNPVLSKVYGLPELLGRIFQNQCCPLFICLAWSGGAAPVHAMHRGFGKAMRMPLSSTAKIGVDR